MAHARRTPIIDRVLQSRARQALQGVLH
jgi:hypothetical protein